MPDEYGWFWAGEETEMYYVSAGGYLLMGCTTFRLEDKLIKILVNEQNVGNHPIAIGKEAFIEHTLKIPELFVSDTALELPGIWWTGEGWIDKQSQLVKGPMAVMV